MTHQQIKTNLKNGLVGGFSTSFSLIKTVVPFYIAVDLLRSTHLTETLGGIFAPFMSLFGLSGKMAIALLSGYLVNIYAAIAAMVPLNPTWQQATIVGLMSGIAHNLIVEGAILKKIGANPVLVTLLRVGVSLVAGLMLHLFFRVVYGY